MPEDKKVVFTVEIQPDTVELDAQIGAAANEAEAFDLCARLLGAVSGFNRGEFGRGDAMK